MIRSNSAEDSLVRVVARVVGISHQAGGICAAKESSCSLILRVVEKECMLSAWFRSRIRPEIWYSFL
jgi:hypothetical protein